MVFAAKCPLVDLPDPNSQSKWKCARKPHISEGQKLGLDFLLVFWPLRSIFLSTKGPFSLVLLPFSPGVPSREKSQFNLNLDDNGGPISGFLDETGPRSAALSIKRVGSIQGIVKERYNLKQCTHVHRHIYLLIISILNNLISVYINVEQRAQKKEKQKHTAEHKL